jgi:transposase
MDATDEMTVARPEDVQVVAKPRRRAYPAEYKRRILKAADACTTPGAIGALLRREGLYSSHLVAWRRARGSGELAALAPKKRGRKPTPVVDPRDRKIAELERQLAAMTGRAQRAEALVDAQKNLAALLGRPGAIAQS